MATTAEQKIKALQSKIEDLEDALGSGEKVVKFTDGTLTEYRSVEEIKAAVQYFTDQITRLNEEVPHRAYTVRVNQGYV
ncbi:MAG: hypothetical protein AAF358_13705 [Pseudomonadota bacterium]